MVPASKPNVGAIDEDTLLDQVIGHYAAHGWITIYRTRPVVQGAIGGVDAILLKGPPWQFVFIDAKGSMRTPPERSLGFTNCLGALIKRIRFERGYRSNEATRLFLPYQEQGLEEVRRIVHDFGTHKNSEYVLALPAELGSTVRDSLDPTLASLLHIRVFLVSRESFQEFRW